MTLTKSKNRLDAIVKTCRLLHRINRQRKSDPIYYEMLADYYERLSRADKDGSFVAAHTIFFPAEILTAMDIVPMHAEMTSWMIALFTADVSDPLAAAAERGYASEICSAHRLLSGALNMGILPRPNVVAWTNIVCDSSFKSGMHIQEFNGVPGFLIDHPFQHSEAEEKYLMRELEDLVSFLEQQSGRKLSEDRLAEVMARVDRQIQLYREINDLRKAVPSPMPGSDFLKLFTMDCLFSGYPRALDYLETLRDQMADLVRQGQGVAAPEKFRILSISMPPLRLMSAIERIFNEHGAVTVADPFLCEFGEGRLDAARPLENVARKMTMLPPMCMWGPLDHRATDRMVGSAKEHKVDGVVFWSQLGCGQTGATIKFFKDRFAEIDVPMLTINADIVDVTPSTEDELRVELERFFEFLGDR